MQDMQVLYAEENLKTFSPLVDHSGAIRFLLLAGRGPMSVSFSPAQPWQQQW